MVFKKNEKNGERGMMANRVEGKIIKEIKFFFKYAVQICHHRMKKWVSKTVKIAVNM